MIVEGSVQRAGGRVRVTAQLIRASTDRHLWANSYDRDLSDALKLEAEVAQAIAREIQAKVTPEESARLASARSVMPEAREEFLLGRYQSWKQSLADVQGAVAHFDRAIQMNPSYADAWAGLSLAWQNSLNLGYPNSREAREVAHKAAIKALELDPNLSDAHAAIAALEQDDWNWAGADREYRRALELNPESLEACACYAVFLWGVMGRHQEAIDLAERFARTNPLSSNILFTDGLAFYAAHRYEEAIPRLRRALELEPRNALAHNVLALTHLKQGRIDEALAAVDGPEFRFSSVRGLVYASQGRRAEALEIARALEKPAAFTDSRGLALIYFALGERDRGLQWFARALDAHDHLITFAKFDPPFDAVRSDPRFQAQLARLKLPE